WRTITPGDAAAGARAVASLSTTQGKVFANLTPPQAVAYLVQTVAKQFPAGADAQAMVSGDQLHVRGVVSLRDMGGPQVLGPLATVVGARDTVELAGRVDLIRPGLAQMHVTMVRLHTLDLPAAMIPRVVHAIRRDSPPGIATDALALPLPPYVGDIRIANGKVTLYKNVQ
ncbi:MAG TPA: hypothetical protein VGT98_07730, partial [Candidatus Elarobacter sp.]|nr:hypothetical protein [Candidatus Elarobacter sp.]